MPRESFESALERLLAEQRHNRRRFVGRAGSRRSPRRRWRVPAPRAAAPRARTSGATRRAPEAASHPKEEFDEVVFSNWPLYIDKKVLKDFRARRREGQVHRGHQRQPGVLRQGPPAAPAGRRHRPRPGRADRLDGRPLDPPQLRRAARQEEHPEQVEPRRQPAQRLLRPGPRLLAAVAVGHDRRSATTAQTGDVTSIEQFFDPKYKGKVTMLADAREASSMVLFMQGKRPDEATIDDVLGAIEYIDEQNRKGHIRRFTGNDYTGDLQAATSRWRRRTPATSSSSRPTTPNLKFVDPRAGRGPLVGQHDDPAEAAHGLRRGGLHELRLRPRGRGEDRGVRQLRAAGQGRQGDPRQDRRRSWPTTR